MHVNEFFHITCLINLQRRRKDYIDAGGNLIKGREAGFLKQLTNHDITALYIDAIDGSTLDLPKMISSDGTPISNGDIGCVLSHLKLVKMARQSGIPNYLVLEDDVEFAPDFNDRFSEAIGELPADWDMLYLGGSHMEEPVPVTQHIARISNTFTTHAIGIRHTVYDDLIAVWEKQNEKVDISLSSLHRRYNCYVIRPHIAFQAPGYSDILNKEVDYQHLRK